MQYVTLGKTGLRISRIGFGGIPIQRITEDECVKLFDEVIAQGINFIDTARGYTVSEQFIGNALRGRRDKFILATKSMARTRQGMEKDIAISLVNLQTDYIDLYQIHNANDEQLDEVLAEGGAMEALRAAKAQGKIGHIGLTAHGLSTFERALEIDEIETVMFPYNIVECQGEQLIARCTEKNIGFIAMKPLAGGAIEDGTLAMRYILANPAVTVVIPGMYCIDEVKENAAAADNTSPLTADEQTRANAIVAQLGEHFCRRCNYCAPCTVGINISGAFLFEGYLSRYGLESWARDRYASMSVKASACVNCGLCEERCPYHLPIREMLKRCAEQFGE
ncbi:MAG: aldo/keto reductase [Clostridia bacterium]|nr:aldo/keto reductase [Clostridia bacterium]